MLPAQLDNRELRKRGGGLFGANPLTGSIGVVTINMPQLAYLSESEDDFYSRLEILMVRAKDSLEIKRKVLEGFTENNLYPYTKHYLSDVHIRDGRYWGNHFSTIGLVGMNEACLNLLNTDIASIEGKEFARQVLEFMRDIIKGFQTETGNFYNLEATPAEGVSYRLARKDRDRFADIKTSGTNEPYYTIRCICLFPIPMTSLKCLTTRTNFRRVLQEAQSCIFSWARKSMISKW